MALPTNNLIMSGILIQSFRHLEYQNLSIISGDIGRASWMQNLRWKMEGQSTEQRTTPVLYWMKYEIPSCRANQYGRLDTLNTKIHPLVQIL